MSALADSGYAKGSQIYEAFQQGASQQLAALVDSTPAPRLTEALVALSVKLGITQER